jgi:enoyl-CoA hydratase/carnithine racemase
MINRVVAPDILMEAAYDFAKRLIAKSSQAVAGSKLSVNAIAAVAAREVTTVQPELFIHSPEVRGIESAV